MRVTVAPSAPGVSALPGALVVPAPVMTLPVAGSKLPEAIASVSILAVGTSSRMVMVSVAVAMSPSASVTVTAKSSLAVSPMVFVVWV